MEQMHDSMMAKIASLPWSRIRAHWKSPERRKAAYEALAECEKYTYHRQEDNSVEPQVENDISTRRD